MDYASMISYCGTLTGGSTALDVDGVPREAAGRRCWDEVNELWIVLCAKDKLLWTEVG